MLTALLVLAGISFRLCASDKNNGVILLYHHVSEQTPAITSTTPEQFAQHMQMLAAEYQVIPLTEMVNALKQGKTLPDKAISISFDDGYANIYHNAHPVLQKYKFPYTVFINPAAIGTTTSQLNWQQIRHMQKQGADFANHTNSHGHLLARKPTENQQQWLARVMADIQAAQVLMDDNLVNTPKLFAYPYGEFNQTLKHAISNAGYIGFGQQSGAIASYSDFAALPRFPAAGIYANPKTLQVKLRSLAMPVTALQGYKPELTFGEQPVNLAITINTADINPRHITCYQQGEKVQAEWQGASISITLNHPLKAGRSRLNCTAQSLQSPKRYYWYSLPWFMPTEQGKWLN